MINATRLQLFTTEAKRIEYLFELYEKYTGGMFVEEKPQKLKKQQIHMRGRHRKASNTSYSDTAASIQ